MSTKKKEMLLSVIEMYKNMPYLWDREHKNYKNQEMRKNANKMLLEVYQECESEATMKTLVKKIQNLRTGYFKELNKVCAYY